MKRVVNTKPFCKSCASPNLIKLMAETCIHPPLNGLKMDPIFVFPDIVVCADCGFVQFHLSQLELEEVRECVAKPELGSFSHSA